MFKIRKNILKIFKIALICALSNYKALNRAKYISYHLFGNFCTSLEQSIHSTGPCGI